MFVNHRRIGRIRLEKQKLSGIAKRLGCSAGDKMELCQSHLFICYKALFKDLLLLA
jgi:hypothetical protein